MKAESRQIPQKLAARLKFVCCSFSKLNLIQDFSDGALGPLGATEHSLGTTSRGLHSVHLP